MKNLEILETELKNIKFYKSKSGNIFALSQDFKIKSVYGFIIDPYDNEIIGIADNSNSYWTEFATENGNGYPDRTIYPIDNCKIKIKKVEINKLEDVYEYVVYFDNGKIDRIKFTINAYGQHYANSKDYERSKEIVETWDNIINN